MERSIQIAFGDAVRDARVNHGYSQEELADLCGMHRTYISDIERGLRNVSLENIDISSFGYTSVSPF